MCYRTCPVCKEKIWFLDILGPGFKGMGERVKCPKCFSVVSGPWRDMMWITILGFPLGYFLPGMIVGYFGLQEAYWRWVVLIVFIWAFFLLLCAIFPLALQYEDRVTNTIDQESSSTNRVTALLRPYSKIDKYLFGFSVALFFTSVFMFAFGDILIAKLIFFSSVILFVVFLVKRIKVQLNGQQVTLLDLDLDSQKLSFTKLKNGSFVETEIDSEFSIPIEMIKKVKAVVIGGGVSDPNITISLELSGGAIIYNELPFHLGKEAKMMVDLLSERLNSVELEIDDQLKR